MDETAIDAEVDRRVEAIRRDLQASFDEKRRAAALQERRARDRIKQDQQEWEAHKRTERRRLADEAETLRRRQGNAHRQVEQRQQAQSRFEHARAQAEERSARADAFQEKVAAQMDDLEARLQRARQSARWGAGALAVVAAMAWLLSGVDNAPAVVAIVGGIGAAWIWSRA